MENSPNYAALAQQSGATASTNPAAQSQPDTTQQPSNVDYATLANQSGATASTNTSASQPGALSRFVSGAYHELADPITAAVTGIVDPPRDATEHVISNVGGPGAIGAYRLAKQLVDSTHTALKAKPEDFKQATQDLQKAVQDFHDNHYVNTASDIGSLYGDVTNLNPTEPSGVGSRIRALSQGAAPGGDLATPLGQTAGDIAGAYLGEKAGNAIASKTSALNPVEATVAKNVGKAGLDAGEDVAAGAQQHLQDSVAETLNQVADEKGVARPTPAPAPDMVRNIADSVYSRSKAAYSAMDRATDGAFQPVADAISNINDELRDKMGIDPVQDAKLQTQKANLLKQQDDLFDQAEANGVPKETVAKAKSDFISAQALYDTSNQFQSSALSDNPDLLNAKTLTNRLTKFNVTGDGGSASRLAEAVGPDHAANLINHAKTSQFMSKLPVTESKALTQIIEPNTSTSLFRGGSTDWGKTLKDFDALGSDGQRAQFKNPEAVRDYLKGKVRQSRIATGVKATAGTVALGAIGGEAFHAAQ